MLVQIDKQPLLNSIWKFGEFMCVPVALVLTLSAVLI